MKNYFKKFSITFVVALCLVFVGIENSVFASTVTWNPNDKGSGVTLSNNNLTTTFNGIWNYTNIRSSKYVTSGKWYCELKLAPECGSTLMFGVANNNFNIASNDFSSVNQLSFYGLDADIYPNGNSYGIKYNANDVIGMAIDVDNKKIKFSVNGNWYNDIQLPTWDQYYVYLGSGSGNTNNTSTINFGGTPFAYGIPTGYSSYDSEAVSNISLSRSSDILQVGQTDNLVATTTPAGATVNWTSSDSSIATVDSTGKVTALKEGQAVITATTADGLTATCVITVTTKTTEPTNPDPTDSDKIVNIAHAKGDNTNNAGGDVTIIFHGAADTTLSVVKTADVKDVWVGDNFTYTIVVTNTGTKTAKAVVVNDPAPNHIDFVVNGITTTQGTVDSSSTSKNIIVNVGDIAPGATVTIKVPATVIL